jgi:lipoate-protein ligase A
VVILQRWNLQAYSKSVFSRPDPFSMWRLLHTPAAPGAFNMALDETLMSFARDTSCWVLRVYGWSVPTLSFGRNQTARGGYDLQRLAERGIDVVRRPTGGRAILHDHEVTYSVVGPANVAGDLRESYERINRLLIAALRALGVDGAAVAGERARVPEREMEQAQPGLTPCFHHPSIGEITLDGRKLVGSAQWRSDGALLQHGSILVDDDQLQISSLLIDKGPPIPRAATLRDALARVPDQCEVADALFAAVRTLEDPEASVVDDPSLFERAHAQTGQYLDPGWTWRR